MTIAVDLGREAQNQPTNLVILCQVSASEPYDPVVSWFRCGTVDSEIFARILFSRIVLKEILVMREFRN